MVEMEPTATIEEKIAGAVKLIPFAKMQGLGNDFVLIEQSKLHAATGCIFHADELSKIARTLCDRHFGVGADGLIVATASTSTDCALGWHFFNNDGSKSAMCGNGLRCLALFARQNNLTESDRFQIETEKGPIPIIFKNADQIQIDLGEPILESNHIPVSGTFRPMCVKEKVKAGDTTFDATFVSMGNPHCVIFQSPVDKSELANYAALIQSLDLFPEGVNVEFAYVESTKSVKVFAFERGVGKTLACASGAAATMVAGVLEGRLDRTAQVILPGGSLNVDFNEHDNHVRLIGPAALSYTGVVDLMKLLAEAVSR